MASRADSPSGGGNGLSLVTAGMVTAVALLAALGLERANQAQVVLAEQRLAHISTAHYEIRYDPAQFASDRIRALAEERESIFSHLVSRFRYADDSLAFPLNDARIRIVLFPDFASKRAATSSDRPFNVSGTTVRVLLYGYIDRLDPAADAAAILHATWGPAGNPAMETWVARLLAGEYRGRTVEDWASQIENELGHYSLTQLLAADAEHFISPLVCEPLGAAWTAFIYQRNGLDAVRRLYVRRAAVLDIASVAEVLRTSPSQLEADWATWARQLQPAQPFLPRQPRPLPGEFLRGVSFSHEGFGGRRGGYVDPEASAQLRKLRSIGANAISVIPYGLVRDSAAPVISTSFTDETDEELTQALHMAHQLGLQVMLKPQLWVSFGQFTGTIRFDDPAKRSAWMRSYREFILHYARLAENEGFDLLCIGNELEGMTALETEWRQLIADVRRVYHGPITYAANWGTEFESLRFWDAVDFVGLNNYYPLTRPLKDRTETPNLDTLSGARAVAARLDEFYLRWRKPILFTEVGYPSLRGGTAEPWIEDASRGLSPAEQAAGYAAVFETFSRRPWLRGMFWWKWPSHGRGGGPQDASFVPLGKPAEEVLRAWYTRMASGNGPAPASGP